MSKIDELIAKLCPNGVEYKMLGELGILYTGLTGKSKDDFSDGNFRFISYKNVYDNIAVNLAYDNYVKIYDGEKQNNLVFGDILFTGSSETPEDVGMSSVVTTNMTEQIYLNSFCFGYRLNNKSLYLPDFLKYLFRSSIIRSNIIKCASGVTRFNVSKKLFLKILIPVPPLEIQREIVKVLDTFTKLEAELEAELEARRRQYHYYRDQLLSFNNEVEYIKLIDVCEYVDYRGKTPKKAEAGIFLVTAKNIRKGFIDYDVSKEYISHHDYEDVMRRGKPKLGDVLITTEAPCGYVAQVDNENIALAQRVIKYRSKTPKLNNTFLKYVLLGTEFQNKLDKTATGATVKGIKGSKLHQLTIPVPPLEEQARIVTILDKFDALVNDLSNGLPAEIAARRKQYEHYRDRLLTFKEAQ